MAMKVLALRCAVILAILLVITSLTVIVLAKYTSLFDFRDDFYMKSIVIYASIIPAIFLAWRYRSASWLIALSVVFVGRTLNVITGVANRGLFPVSGYSVSDFADASKTADYYFLASSSTPLAILGDHAIILGGASIGDILILVGWLVIFIGAIWGCKKERSDDRC